MKIVVLSDGETWELLGPQILVCDVGTEDFKHLLQGECPRHLGLEGIKVEVMGKFNLNHSIELALKPTPKSKKSGEDEHMYNLIHSDKLEEMLETRHDAGQAFADTTCNLDYDNVRTTGFETFETGFVLGQKADTDVYWAMISPPDSKSVIACFFIGKSEREVIERVECLPQDVPPNMICHICGKNIPTFGDREAANTIEEADSQFDGGEFSGGFHHDLWVAGFCVCDE